MFTALVNTAVPTLPGVPETSMLVPAALVAMILAATAAVLARLRSNRDASMENGPSHGASAPQPVASEEAEHLAALQQEMPAEDDVAYWRRRRLTEATRDS